MAMDPASRHQWNLSGAAARAVVLGLVSIVLGLAAPAAAGPLILYIGPPGGEYAAAARSGVTLRLGFTEDEIAGAEPIVEYVFGGAELWPLGGVTNLCPRGRDDVDLAHQIIIADKAIDEMEFSTAAAALEPVADRLGCITAGLDQGRLSRAAFLLGYSRFQTGDRDGALEGFKLAAGFEPAIEWDPNYPPDAQQVFNSGVLSALRVDMAQLVIPEGRLGEGVLELDGAALSASSQMRPGLHQLTVRKRAGGTLRVALSFPVGESVEMVPVGTLVDGFLVGRDEREAMTDALVDVMGHAGRDEVYIVEPDSGRIFRFHAPSRALRLIPGPSTPMSVPETPARRVVQRYYAQQDIPPPEEWLDAGTLAAKVLMEQGYTETTLDLAVDQAHELIAGAKHQPFETIVPPLAQQFPTHGERPADMAVDDIPVNTPPGTPDATGSGTEPAAGGSTDAATVSDVTAPITRDSATTADTDTAITVRRRGIKPVGRAALIIAGSAALVGGMIAGAGATAYYSNISGYDQPGGTVAIGLIPLAGPFAGWGYWSTYGEYWLVQGFVPLSLALTVVEVVGTALIITAVALPKPVEVPVAAGPRRLRPTVIVAPSFEPGGGGLVITGRF